MYNDLVKRLLEKHFGPPKKTLAIGNTEEVGNSIYYYTLEKEKEITAIRDLLAKQSQIAEIEKFPELKQAIPGDSNGLFDIPQCVHYKEENGHWYADFFTVTGISYHRTYGNRVAASLILRHFPIVSLSDRKADLDFYGFWAKGRTRKKAPYLTRDGLSYWMNKALRTNRKFRDFAADFFYEVGKAEKKYILKDVARSIKDCGFFIPDISYPNLIKYRTPSALIRSFLDPNVKLNVAFNKVDINVAYAMVKLADSIDRRDWNILTGFGPKDISDAVTLNMFYEGFSVGEFVRSYYVNKLSEYYYNSRIYTCAQDYVEMSLQLGEPMRLCYDEEGLICAHDELSDRTKEKVNEIEFELPLVTEPSRFDELEKKIEDTGAEGFERIRTTERLFFESETQHNCVFSRRQLIREDQAAVFHWSHNGNSYTIQFSIDQQGNYCVDEIYARYNVAVTKQDLQDLQAILEGICYVSNLILLEVQIRDENPDPIDRFQLSTAADIFRLDDINDGQLDMFLPF